VGAQHRHGFLVEGNGPAAVRLRRPGLGAVAELHNLLAYVEAAPGQVDLGPRQPDRLAAAQAAEGDQVVERVQPVGSGVVKERAGLLRCPNRR
jgi:hypothetical protein